VGGARDKAPRLKHQCQKKVSLFLGFEASYMDTHVISPCENVIAEQVYGVSLPPQSSFDSTTPALRFRVVLADETNVGVVLAKV
jgi:hypothetical protein